MKKLITILALSLISAFGNFGYSQVRVSDVYLQRVPINNYTYITTDGSTGHRMLTSAFCCGNFGPDDLKIVCDSANGVYVQGSAMHVEDYFELTLIDPWCSDHEYELGYKEVIYLESQGNQFPWCNQNGIAVNCADPVEWDSLTHYGIPLQSLAFAPYVQHVDPSFDCATGVTKGREDCYSFNLNFDLDAAGVPDGTYVLEAAINLPPNNPFDPGVYPNDYKRLCHIQGMNFTWTTVMPPQPVPPSNPTNVQGVVQNSKIVNLNWNQAGAVTGYKIQKYISKGPNSGQASGSPIMTSTKPVSITPGKGFWKFGVTALNCSSPSTEIWSNEVHCTK